jgi:ATP-binding cassette subfamily F protein 3
MVNVENISKSYGGQVLLEDASFRLNKGERAGLVGRNGHGKTTIFRMMIGEETPDSGQVSFPKRYVIGHLKQHLDFTENTVIEEGCKGLREEDEGQVWKVEKILFGLGFTEDDMYRHPSEFSGGYQVRLDLAKVLVSEPNMLLLDEPTNYLDITSVRWLENFLRSWKGELMLITHDRSFMDAVVTHTVAIHRKKIRKIEGDTGKLYEQIAMEEEIYEKTRLNEEQKRKEVEAFITRFKSKASLASRAQSRVKMLEKMGSRAKLEDIKDLDFGFRYKPYEGKTGLNAKGITFGYDKNDPLINDFSINITTGERVCIIGKNGKGKTTLLKLLAGEMKPDAGEVYYGPGIEKGFYEQTNIKTLDDRRTIEEELLQTAPDVDRQRARNIAGIMMFEGDSALKKIGVLSGGEKSRVMLGKLLAQHLNFLMLDEPTNHLDMQSCDSLLEALDDFPGTLLLITHNEMFLHALADRLIVFKNNSISVFDGTYAEFLEKEGWDEEEETTKPKKKVTSQGKLTKKELRKRRSDLLSEKSRVVAPLEKRVRDTETAIETAEKRMADINSLLVAASESGDTAKISSLSKELNEWESEIEKLFTQLEKSTEDFEFESAKYETLLKELGDDDSDS